MLIETKQQIEGDLPTPEFSPSITRNVGWRTDAAFKQMQYSFVSEIKRVAFSLFYSPTTERISL